MKPVVDVVGVTRLLRIYGSQEIVVSSQQPVYSRQQQVDSTK
jgi:hypothetical protein